MNQMTTGRLILREFINEDAPFIIRLLNSAGWLQYIGDRNVKTIEDAQSYLQNGPMKSYSTNGFGLWLVALKTSAEPIGMCGLIKREGLDDIDIGFALLPEFMGKGYAYEMAIATLEYARRSLGCKRILAITAVDNNASTRLLSKMGFAFEKLIRLSGNEQELNLFAYDA